MPIPVCTELPSETTDMYSLKAKAGQNEFGFEYRAADSRLQGTESP